MSEAKNTGSRLGKGVDHTKKIRSMIPSLPQKAMNDKVTNRTVKTVRTVRGGGNPRYPTTHVVRFFTAYSHCGGGDFFARRSLIWWDFALIFPLGENASRTLMLCYFFSIFPLRRYRTASRALFGGKSGRFPTGMGEISTDLRLIGFVGSARYVGHYICHAYIRILGACICMDIRGIWGLWGQMRRKEHTPDDGVGSGMCCGQGFLCELKQKGV